MPGPNRRPGDFSGSNSFGRCRGLPKRGSQFPVEGLHPSHSPPAAARQVNQVPCGEIRVTIGQGSGEDHILLLEAPHFGETRTSELKRPVEGIEPAHGEVDVEELLEDLRGADERCAPRGGGGEEGLSPVTVRMLSADRVDEDVRVDEGQGASTPPRIDRSRVSRCSSHSGSGPEPAARFERSKKLRTSSALENRRSGPASARSRAAVRIQALRD